MNAIGDVLDRTKDPLLQPFRLRHLTLRNRVMSTAHEPYYSEDGMPKDRYRLYHVEKARGGVALLGIESVMAPRARRTEAWDRLARELDLAKLDAMTRTIGLADVRQAAEDILAGRIRGRVVVEIGG